MLFLNDFTFTYYYLAALLVAVIGLYRWFQLTLSLRLLLFYIVIGPFSTLFSTLFLEGLNDSVMLNLIRIMQMSLLGSAFVLHMEKGSLRKITVIVVGGALLFALVNFFFLQGMTTGNTYTLYAAAGLALFLGLSYLHSFELGENLRHALLQPWTLFSMAIVAQSLNDVAYSIIFTRAVESGLFGISSLGKIHRVIHLLYFIIITVGLLRQRKQTPKPQWTVS